MKLELTTVLGNFDLFMSYVPSADDRLLNRFTSAINKSAAYPMIIAAEANPDLNPEEDIEKLSKLAIELVDEAKLEKALFDCTRVADGAGQRTTLSLKDRKIELTSQ